MSPTTTLPRERIAAILQSVVASQYPRQALPTIAANNDLTLHELQQVLNGHGYPDKTKMRQWWAKLLQDGDNQAAGVDPADHRWRDLPQTAGPKRDPYVAALPISDLFADPAYQRELDELRVQRMVTRYDAALVGIVEVSQRPDGRYAILDGQHRWATVRDHEFGTTDRPHIACRVHTGLTVGEEAKLYHQLNTTRKQLTGWDRWLARRAAGEQLVLDIEACVTEHGFTVGIQTAPGILRATRACEMVVDLGGISLLAEVLTTIGAAYGDDQAGLDGAIVHGLGHVIKAYDREELDAVRLVEALQGIVPRQLTARAAAVREIHKGTLDRLTGHVIVERYNALKGRKVEPFFDRVKPLTKTKGTEARRNEAIREWATREGLLENGKRNLTKSIRAAYDAAHRTADKGTVA